MSVTHVILFSASPEVDTACIAGDVEHSQALETRQRHGNPVTLKTRREERTDENIVSQNRSSYERFVSLCVFVDLTSS